MQTNNIDARRNEFSVESVTGQEVFVSAVNFLDAIYRAGFTPETTYRVDLCYLAKLDGRMVDKRTTIYM